MYISRGKNVCPAAVERLLLAYPDVWRRQWSA
jgi:hypothetical protein